MKNHIFFVVNWRSMLNKRSSCSRFTTKAVERIPTNEKWNIYVDGHSFKGIKSIYNSSVMQSYAYVMLIRKKLKWTLLWMGCRKCPFHRYWILIIPWFLNRRTASHFPWILLLFWKSCWTNRWVFLIRNLNLCEQSVICQVQLNYDLMLSTTDDQDPVISYDLNFGHDVFAINTV